MIKIIISSEKLRFLREARNKTQKDLAKDLGISVNSYAKLEMCDVGITIDRLEAICDILQVKPFQVL